MPQGVSIREFARLDGCSHTAVQLGLKSGRLKALDDGSIDPTLAGSSWRSGNYKVVRGGKPRPEARQVATKTRQVAAAADVRGSPVATGGEGGPPIGAHLSDPYDCGAAAMAYALAHRMGATLALSVVESGGPMAVAQAAEKQATVSAFEITCMVLDELKVPPPPGSTSWETVAIIDEASLAFIDWAKVTAA